MSYLKTGFLPEVLAERHEQADDEENVAAMIESWAGWEKGNTRPEVVLAVLQDSGIVDLLTELSS